jgi:glycosyltransferase involved in cell wall biosynthesis
MFRTGLGSRLPNSWRTRIHWPLSPLRMCYLHIRLRKLHRPASGPQHLGECRVAVLGLFRRRVALGRAADLLANELELEGALVTKVDVTDVLGRKRNQIRDDVNDFGILELMRFDAVILHLNPSDFCLVRLRLPFDAVRYSCLVGYFAWELDRAPASWFDSVACCNQIWVPSAFVAQAIERSFPEARAKLRVREHRVELEKLPKRTSMARNMARRRLRMRNDAFVVLTSFSANSNVARKNPVAAVEAFCKAVECIDAPAQMLVRCLDFEAFEDELRPLKHAVSRDPRIRLVLIGQFESSDIEDAYLAADIYISLHRSEGFGLNLAEALTIGMPVIATRWGLTESIAGHPNFTGVPSRLVPVIDPQHIYDQVPDAHWAEPDIEFAAIQLRKRIKESGAGTKVLASPQANDAP